STGARRGDCPGTAADLGPRAPDRRTRRRHGACGIAVRRVRATCRRQGGRGRVRGQCRSRDDGRTMIANRYRLATDARGVATLTLDRPEVANAYDENLLRGLTAALQSL